jgi:HEAT repeat protein
MNQRSAIHEITDLARPLRASSVVMLSGLEVEERDELAGILSGTPVERRLQLVRRLVDLGEDDATLDFGPVFTLLLEDSDAAVRRLAIEGLWEYEDRTLIEPLVRLFRSDGDETVREAAALALGRYVVLNEFGSVRPRDAERVAEALRAVIADRSEPVRVRRRAVEAAGASSEPWATGMIREAYEDDEPLLQVSALHAMGRNSDPSWLPTLYAEMESDDPQRRFEAAGAAGQIGDEDAVPRLGDLIDDEDPEVQEAAIAALGAIGGDWALTRLRSRLGDPEPRIDEAVQAAIASVQAAEGLIGASGPPGRRDAEEDDDEE